MVTLNPGGPWFESSHWKFFQNIHLLLSVFKRWSLVQKSCSWSICELDNGMALLVKGLLFNSIDPWFESNASIVKPFSHNQLTRQFVAKCFSKQILTNTRNNFSIQMAYNFYFSENLSLSQKKVLRLGPLFQQRDDWDFKDKVFSRTKTCK